MPHLLEVFDDVLVRQFLLLQFDLEGTLVLAEVEFAGAVGILLQAEGDGAAGLQLRDVVLVLVQQVLHLLLVDLVTRTHAKL